MELTEQEIQMVETIREWSKYRDGLRFTAIFENGAWECTLTSPLPNKPPLRGVGTTFVDAFNNLDVKVE
jgi:hypothetical protein